MSDVLTGVTLNVAERRLATWTEATAEDLLSAMEAARTWLGPHFAGAANGCDMDGNRVSDDPPLSVVEPDVLEVQDTLGVRVFGGPVHTTSPGFNPTLTIWAVADRSEDWEDTYG